MEQYLQYWPYLLPLLAVPAYLVVKYFSLDLAPLKTKAVKVAGVLQHQGLTTMADVLAAMATGNVKTISVAVYKLVEEYNDGDTLEQELDKLFDKMLTAHATDPEKRKALEAKLSSLGVTSS